MNKINIGTAANGQNDPSTLTLTYEDANKMLPILRSDHFKLITLNNISEVDPKNLKFLIQFGRLLKAEVPAFVCRAQSSCKEMTRRD